MTSRGSSKHLTNALVRSYVHEVERSEKLHKKSSFFNSLLATGPLKHQKMFRFSDVFKRYVERIVAQQVNPTEALLRFIL